MRKRPQYCMLSSFVGLIALVRCCIWQVWKAMKVQFSEVLGWFLLFRVISDVEEVMEMTLQFSTSVEVRPGVVVGLLVHHQISITALRILLIFGQKLDIDILRKLTEPFFRKKYWMIQNFKKNCIFWYLRIFLVNFSSKDFLQTFRNGRILCYEHPRFFSGPKKIWNPLFSSRLQIIIFVSKFNFFFQSLQMAQFAKLIG